MIRFILCIIVVIFLGIYSIPYAIVSFFVKDKKKILSNNNKIVRTVFNIVLHIAGVKIHTYGTENLDSIRDEKALFFISNHRGYFDILTGYSVINRDCSIVAKNSLKKIPIVGYWMEKIECQFLDRNDLRSGAMMVVNSIKLLSEGISVWLFPEGTRNKNEDPLELLEFKGGSFKIPDKADCYIVPMAILNSEAVFEKQFPRVKSADVYINIGKPYKMSELEKENYQNIAEYSRQIMISLLKELVIKKES